MKRDLSFLPELKSDNAKPQTVSVNVYPEDRVLVKEVAKRLGITMTDAFHEAIELWYKDLEAKYTKAEA